MIVVLSKNCIICSIPEALELLYQIYSLDEDLDKALKILYKLLEIEPGNKEYIDLISVCLERIFQSHDLD